MSAADALLPPHTRICGAGGGLPQSRRAISLVGELRPGVLLVVSGAAVSRLQGAPLGPWGPRAAGPGGGRFQVTPAGAAGSRRWLLEWEIMFCSVAGQPWPVRNKSH